MNKKTETTRWIAWCACLLLAVGCSGNATGADAGPDARGSATFETLRSFPHTRGGRTWNVDLVRITQASGERTYVQWISSDIAGPRPTVMMTMPYSGIDWSGEALDERWYTSTAEPDGRYLDTDGPNWDGTSTVVYNALAPDVAADWALLHLLNDFNALLVYGRFYAGGSIENDVNDMVAGLGFLGEQSKSDNNRIGVFGGSWGGFEAMYAAARAPANAIPLVTVAQYPATDFERWHTYATAELPGVYPQPQQLYFFTPYLERVKATTGGTDYAGYRGTDLCSITGDVFIMADNWDVLIPQQHSEDLVALCGSNFSGLWWRRTAPIDFSIGLIHGLLGSEPDYVSTNTFGTNYLYQRLATPNQTVLFSLFAPAAFEEFLNTVRDAQLRGEDVSFVPPQLLEFTETRVFLLDASNNNNVIAGAEAIATALNTVYGTGFDATTVVAALNQGMPTP